jgi:sterol desaturase/sphingolipid hydroxylase (fatty acid hydroxylase superfamily)
VPDSVPPVLTNARDGRPVDVVQPAPIFVWPPKPGRLLRVLLGFPGYLWPWNVMYAGIALVTWQFLMPMYQSSGPISVSSVCLTFLRNAALAVLVAGAWHVRLYVQKAQGTNHKYNARWPATDNKHFVRGNQVLDNVFWTLFSAVPIWTAYEVLMLWAQARGLAVTVTWKQHPVYCGILALLLPIINEAHFYVIHRFLHWPPLYRAAHSLHHKNVNPCPWSGLAMHPIEHMLYFSVVLIFWAIPATPFHILFSLQLNALGPAQTHCGFDKLPLTKKLSISTDAYFHYLHHKYFEVNYGDLLVPLDKWFGTFHDGSEQAQETMRRRLKAKTRSVRS